MSILSGADPILGPSFRLGILTVSFCVYAIVSSHSEAISGFEPAALTLEFQARNRVRLREIMKLASIIGPVHPATFLPVSVICDRPPKANRNFKNKHSKLRSHRMSFRFLRPFTFYPFNVVVCYKIRFQSIISHTNKQTLWSAILYM